jgi:hypothetical protein
VIPVDADLSTFDPDFRVFEELLQSVVQASGT